MALVVVLMLGACAGPEAPLAVGVKELPSDVVLGKDKKPDEPSLAPLPPTALPLDLPTLRIVPSLVSDFGPPRAVSTTTPPAASACPAADPLRAPAKEAVNTVKTPPAAGTYAFRNDGTFELSGSDARRGRLPATSTRTVQNVMNVRSATDSTYRFEVVSSVAGLATTTTYTLVPERADGRPPSAPPGLYLTRVQTTLPDGNRQDFRPATVPGLIVLPFPIAQGATFRAAGTDPRSGITMTYTGTVLSRVRVDACGTPLDAWSVRLDGSVGGQVSPSGRDQFTATYSFGTQYGALSLADEIVLDRESPSSTLRLTNRATINVEPEPPSGNVRLCVEATCSAP